MKPYLFAHAMTIAAMATPMAILPTGPAQAAGVAQSTAVTASLSEEDIANLTLMREEEKMARDVYLNLYKRWKKPVFNNIASS